jgi:hypothetical protein
VPFPFPFARLNALQAAVKHSHNYLDLESLKIQRSGFNFKSNLTSAIGDLANRDILASYVSRPNAMAYDTCPHK